MDRYKGAKKTPVAHDVEAMTKGLKAGVTPPSETEGGEKRIWSNEEVSGTMREGGGGEYCLLRFLTLLYSTSAFTVLPRNVLNSI